ncbi:hypothetical protein SASPL_121439 [Salvia splendens]|uniref:C17orf113 probable zinc finger domain-containing protein n=1 Tax=Salvia splendens TaxID=180675 RepID=A0A8X8XWG3_SALSN|nr:uncharacterized protein LOC121741119 isoform X5 [Salvia splendens]KAG6419223.1 hypothetical protein SASPL_121439 [Salvia splendens]
MDDPNFQPNSQPNQPIWMPGMFDNHTFYPSGFEGNDAFSASVGFVNSAFSGVMFNTGIASNSALQFLPSYVNPPERAEMLTNTHKEEAVVFVNAQEKERVRCSVCWQYGGVRGEYFSPNGSGNLSLSGFQAHLSSDFHVKSLLAKEKGKQTLETVVTSQNSDLGGASEHGSVTAVSSMEKVSTSVEEIKGVLNEKL